MPKLPGSDDNIDWVQAFSLTANEACWLPRDFCYANAPEPRLGHFNPNGHAAGNSIEEAIIQAFLELVERDAVAIWWYNRIRHPGMCADQSVDIDIRAFAQGLAEQGWKSWLLDLTTDLAIPCFAALAHAEIDGRWFIGFGCHFNADLAAERAMTELAQLFLANGREGPPPWKPIADGDDAYLFPHPCRPWEEGPLDAPVSNPTTMSGHIDWCLSQLERLGLEMIVIDQTHPDIELPVVKVVVPGLRHFWPRFGEGRLYEVPVKLGWRTTPIAETELNPSHLFL